MNRYLYLLKINLMNSLRSFLSKPNRDMVKRLSNNEAWYGDKF